LTLFVKRHGYDYHFIQSINKDKQSIF